MALESYTDSEGLAHWPNTCLNTEKYYGVDWSDWLTNESDTKTSVTWTVPSGLTNMDTDTVEGVEVIKLSADSVGNYEVICTLETIDSGNTQKAIQSVWLKVI